MSVTTFIYALCEPGTRTVRYIGKTNDLKNRMRQHTKDSTKKKTHLGNWLRSLSGVSPELIVFREVSGDGSEAEMRYIRLARGCKMDLVNSTDGGEGVTMTPEIRAKISAANLEKFVSQETRDRQRISALNRPPEVNAKISATLTGRRLTAEHCENISRGQEALSLEARANRSEKQSLAHKGRVYLPRSPEHCASISASKIGRPVPKSVSEAALKKNLGGKHSPETIAKRIKSQLGFTRAATGQFKRMPLFSDGGGI